MSTRKKPATKASAAKRKAKSAAKKSAAKRKAKSATKKSAAKKEAKSAARKTAKTARRRAPRLGSFGDLVSRAPDAIRKLSRAARTMILDVHPDATEVVRLGDGVAAYGVGPAKMSEAHTYIAPHREYVNLGFFYGAHLRDPDGLLEGTGVNMRHVKLRSVDDVARARRLVQTALDERKAALGRS